ncbi:unnamed protein product [Brassica oleracea]
MSIVVDVNRVYVTQDENVYERLKKTPLHIGKLISPWN